MHLILFEHIFVYIAYLEKVNGQIKRNIPLVYLPIIIIMIMDVMVKHWMSYWFQLLETVPLQQRFGFPK